MIRFLHRHVLLLSAIVLVAALLGGMHEVAAHVLAADWTTVAPGAPTDVVALP